MRTLRGVGVGYRPAIRKDILRHRTELDFVEILSDSFLENHEALRALATLVPCVPHSLGLSVGSDVDAAYLRQIRAITDLVDAPWHTDHLAFTRVDDIIVGHLAPVPYTEEALELVVENVRKVQRAIERPFALENVTAAFEWPENAMAEHEFLSRLVARTGCGLLLDLENLRVNEVNLGQDARKVIERLPLESVMQVHLAGGTHAGGMENDTHSAPVSEATWRLFEHLCDLAPPPAALIERDAAFPPFAELLAEVRRARGIMEAAA